jgi:hypothetical protein
MTDSTRPATYDGRIGDDANSRIEEQRRLDLNTRAVVFYAARCTRCLSEPDGDGEEYHRTSREAYAWVLNDENDQDWWLGPDGRILCSECRPEGSWPDA